MLDEICIADQSLQVNTNKLKPKKIISAHAYKDQHIAQVMHNSVALKIFGFRTDELHLTKRYVNGEMGFYSRTPTKRQDWEMLLLKHFPDMYDAKSPHERHANFSMQIKVTHAGFKPYEDFFYYDQDQGLECVNWWEPPDWIKTERGMLPSIDTGVPYGQLPEFMDALFCHLFPDLRDRQIVKRWFKQTLEPRRPNVALCLIGLSRCGKSALMQLLSALHGHNAHTAYNIEQFSTNNFVMGSLEDKTLTILSEGQCQDSSLQVMKNFVNNPYFNVNQKNVKERLLKNYNSLAITTDKDNALRKADQALLNRFIIPRMGNELLENADVTMEDGRKVRFLPEWVMRTYNMTEKNDAKQSLRDTVALGRYLQSFEDTTINLNSPDVVGYHDKLQGFDNFMLELDDWECRILKEHIAPEAIRREPSITNKYEFTSAHVKNIIAEANLNTSMKLDLMAAKHNSVNLTNIKPMGKRNTVFLDISRVGTTKQLTLKIDVEFTQYLLDIDGPTPTKPTPPDPKPEPVKPKEPDPTDAIICGAPVTTSLIAGYCFIDFEFQLHCKTPRLMACVLRTASEEKRYWLWQSDTTELSQQILRLNEQNYTFVTFTDAEARCFYQLNLNPLSMKWIDCQIMGLPFYHSSKEFQNFAVHNALPEEPFDFDELSEEELAEHDDKSRRKRSASLLGFYRFFCNKDPTSLSLHKEAIRQLIINMKPQDLVDPAEQKEIMQYCASDVTVLHELFIEQIHKLVAVTGRTVDDVIAYYTDFTQHRIRCCDMSYHGLPINQTVYNDLCKTYTTRVEAEQAGLPKFYRYNPPKFYVTKPKFGQLKEPGSYTQDQELFERYVMDNNLRANWPKTEKGALKCDEATLQKYSSYPEINALWTAKKRIKQIEQFKPDENGNPKINKFLTMENGILLQHPEFGTFGAATSRNAAKTSTFIMGMERKLRGEILGCLPGMVLLQPDFSAQEVWIGGALSGDKNMLKAAFEDPYIAAGKEAGVIPSHGNKKSHSAERDIFKTIVLAGFYGMGHETLKIKLKKNDDEVRKLRNFIRKHYATFYIWQQEFLIRHKKSRYYELADGWPMLDNQKSTGTYKTTTAMNFPIQGHGAVILRKVVELFYANRPKNTRLIYTLHDEFGVLCPTESEAVIKEFMTEIMQAACKHYFPSYDPPRVGFK